MNVRSLLMSFDLPPAVGPASEAALCAQRHGIFRPTGRWVFSRHPEPGRAGYPPCAGELGRLPESSRYSRPTHQSEPESIYSLVMASWTRNYAAVLLDLPAGEQPWSLQGIIAANTAVIVTRCTLADMAATRHTLILLLERLIGEHRIPREAIYLVLNQVTEHSPISARGFHDELVAGYGWAPPVAAVIPYLPAITQAQDEQIPAVTRVDPLAKAIHNLAESLFPGGMMANLERW